MQGYGPWEELARKGSTQAANQFQLPILLGGNFLSVIV